MNAANTAHYKPLMRLLLNGANRLRGVGPASRVNDKALRTCCSDRMRLSGARATHVHGGENAAGGTL